MAKCSEIVDVIGDVVKSVAGNCTLTVPDYKGGVKSVACPNINYIFGNARYVKDELDELSKTPRGNEIKFPLVALFCPFRERRDSPDYYSKAELNILIACSSSRDWNNEQRRDYSFDGILRPIYRQFIASLQSDARVSVGYDGHIRHEYSENYTYGRYGAHTETGDALSEPIDAINLTKLQITIKQPNCRNYEEL